MSGRNGRNILAMSTENILPKLPLTDIFRYFDIFAKVRLPSITPSSRTLRSFSSRIISATSFAISTAVSTEIPTSACLRGRLSFIPSPI